MSQDLIIDTEMSVQTTYVNEVPRLSLQTDLVIPEDYLNKTIYFKCGPYVCWIELTDKLIIFSDYHNQKVVDTRGKRKALARISNGKEWIMLKGKMYDKSTKEKDIEEINDLANRLKEVCNLRHKEWKETLQLTQ
jgi:hypothetical protein